MKDRVQYTNRLGQKMEEKIIKGLKKLKNKYYFLDSFNDPKDWQYEGLRVVLKKISELYIEILFNDEKNMVFISGTTETNYFFRNNIDADIFIDVSNLIKDIQLLLITGEAI